MFLPGGPEEHQELDACTDPEENFERDAVEQKVLVVGGVLVSPYTVDEVDDDEVEVLQTGQVSVQEVHDRLGYLVSRGYPRQQLVGVDVPAAQVRARLTLVHFEGDLIIHLPILAHWIDSTRIAMF